MPEIVQGQPKGAETNAWLSKGSKTRQILELQKVLYDTVINANTKPLERASCARSWEVLEERLRIIRGKPLPGHLVPEERARKRKVKEPDEAQPMSMPKAA